MTDYHFTGAYPRVLTGLSQGINAHLTPAHGDTCPPYGSTIEAHPGDVLSTDAPYPHPELEEITPDTAPAPQPAAPVEPAPPADPAPADPTADGAPAPAPAN